MMIRFILSRPKRILLIYFSLTTLIFLWLIFNIGSICPPSGHGKHQNGLPEEDENRYKELALTEWENKLKRIEKSLRTKFAKEVDIILSETEYSNKQPTIYAITPTYTRPVQKAELTRLKNTFLHVKNFHWIIVEDSDHKTVLVENFLKSSGIAYTHLNVVTPAEFKLQPTDPNWYKPRGVLQRNLGLKWVRENVNPDKESGVVYFADDDNTYSIEIFEQMRYTKKISVWPVGLVGKLRYEGPVVKNGKVVEWFTFWKPTRPFPLDMAGFSLNIQILFDNPEAQFNYMVERGYQESVLLTQLAKGIRREELEPLADNCTKILVWHTRTEKVNLKNEDKIRKLGLPGSDPDMEI